MSPNGTLALILDAAGPSDTLALEAALSQLWQKAAHVCTPRFSLAVNARKCAHGEWHVRVWLMPGAQPEAFDLARTLGLPMVPWDHDQELPREGSR